MSWRRDRGRVGRAAPDRRRRAVRPARLRHRRPADERAPRSARVLAAAVVVPRPVARRGQHPDLEPVRDGRATGSRPTRRADGSSLPSMVLFSTLVARRGDAGDGRARTRCSRGSASTRSCGSSGVGRVAATLGGLRSQARWPPARSRSRCRSPARSRGRRSPCSRRPGSCARDRWSRRIGWLALGAFGVVADRERAPVARARDRHGGRRRVPRREERRIGDAPGRPDPSDGARDAPVRRRRCRSLDRRCSYRGSSSSSARASATGYAAGRASARVDAPKSSRSRRTGSGRAGRSRSARPRARTSARSSCSPFPLALRARRRRRPSSWRSRRSGSRSLGPAARRCSAAGWVRELSSQLPYGDVLLHNPGRLRYVALLALPGARRRRHPGLRRGAAVPRARALAWVAAGALLWLGVPLAAGGRPRALARSSRWRLIPGRRGPGGRRRAGSAWAPRLVVAVLAVELLAGAVLAGRRTGDEIRLGLEAASTPLAFQPCGRADVDLDRVPARPPPSSAGSATSPIPHLGAAGRRIREGLPVRAGAERTGRRSRTSAGRCSGSATCSGYNPVQLPRYWAWIRPRNALPIYYNAAVVQRPSPSIADLLACGILIVPQGVPPPVPGQGRRERPRVRPGRRLGPEPLVSAPTHVRLVSRRGGRRSRPRSGRGSIPRRAWSWSRTRGSRPVARRGR